MDKPIPEDNNTLFRLDSDGAPDSGIEASSTASASPAADSGRAAENTVAKTHSPRLEPKIREPRKGNLSYGKYLRELRELNGYTLADIASETKIRSVYLEALEEEDTDNLPPLAYILGYVRKLCALYSIPRERADELTAELRAELEYELPEDISKSIVDHEISEENERKLRQLLILLAIAAAVVAILLTAGGLLLFSRWKSNVPEPETLPKQTTEATVLKAEDLMKIQPKPEIGISVLPK